MKERGLGGQTGSVLLMAMMLPNLFKQGSTALALGALSAPFLTLAIAAVALLALSIAIQTMTFKIPIRASRDMAKASQANRNRPLNRFLPFKADYLGPSAVFGAMMVVPLISMLTATFGLVLAPGALVTMAVIAAFIILIAVVGTRLQFNPKEIAANLARDGVAIVGKRPGQETRSYLSSVLTFLPLLGAVAVVGMALLPQVLGLGGIGISILITVGSAIAVIDQGWGMWKQQRAMAIQAVNERKSPKTWIGAALPYIMPLGVAAGTVGAFYLIFNAAKLIFVVVNALALAGLASWLFGYSPQAWS